MARIWRFRAFGVNYLPWFTCFDTSAWTSVWTSAWRSVMADIENNTKVYGKTWYFQWRPCCLLTGAHAHLFGQLRRRVCKLGNLMKELPGMRITKVAQYLVFCQVGLCTKLCTPSVTRDGSRWLQFDPLLTPALSTWVCLQPSRHGPDFHRPQSQITIDSPDFHLRRSQNCLRGKTTSTVL